MRVLYLTNNPNRASTTATLEGWLTRLGPRGLRPVVVTTGPGAFHDWLREESIPCDAFPLSWPDRRRPWPFLACLLRLSRLARRHRCEVIHCNEHDVYPVGQYLGRLLRLPVVTGVRFTMSREFCSYAFGGRRRPHRLIFVSRGSREACRPALDGIVPEEDWRVIYNGADLDAYRPDPQSGEAFRRRHGLGDGVLVGTAAALRPVKQYEHIFSAMAALAHPGAKLVVAGGPVPGLEDYARRLLDEGRRTLGDRFVHVGHVDDVRGLLNAVDLYVNASQAEGCSNSIIQALATGTPVLSYPSTSVDEQVLPDGGAIVAQDNVEALGAELGRWVGDPGRLAAAEAPARRRAERDFDIRAICDQLWADYGSLREGPRYPSTLPALAPGRPPGPEV